MFGTRIAVQEELLPLVVFSVHGIPRRKIEAIYVDESMRIHLLPLDLDMECIQVEEDMEIPSDAHVQSALNYAGLKELQVCTQIHPFLHKTKFAASALLSENLLLFTCVFRNGLSDTKCLHGLTESLSDDGASSSYVASYRLCVHKVSYSLDLSYKNTGQNFTMVGTLNAMKSMQIVCGYVEILSARVL
jgi:hypothetical protein